MPILFDGARVAYYDGNGDPLSGGKVYFYEAGTTDAKDTYSSYTMAVGTENQNPVTLDAAGRAGAIYLDGSYKVVVKNSAGVTVFTQDNYSAVFTENARQATNIAAMTAFLKASLTDGDQVNVAGYTTAGDGGGGTFYWDEDSSATANGGTIIASDEAGLGRWMLIYGGAVSVKSFGAVCNGTTADTTKVQAALDANLGHLIVPHNCKHGPVTVTNAVHISFLGDVVPLFDTTTTETLYMVTAPDCVFEDFSVDTYAATNTANKYLIRTDTGGDGIKIIRPKFVDITASDGNTGATNLLVTHPIYLENISRAVVSMGNFNNISGAAIFLKTVTNYSILFNEFDDTRWYTVNADHDCFDGIIAFNKFSGAGVNARYWGGSVNLMSQTTGNKNKRVKVVNNTFTGVHNYGAVVRALSVEDCLIDGNIFYDITEGSLAASTEVQMIGIDRRGTAEGSPENGPCRNVRVTNNIMTAGTGSHFPIYLKNQYKASSDPHENIVIEGNIVYSPSSAAAYENFLMVHGNKSGIKGLKIRNNSAKMYTKTGSAVGGGIGLVSTNADGIIEDFDIGNNTLEELTTDVPDQSYQIGIYVQASAQNGEVRGNILKNFRYGVRAASSLTNIRGLNDNTFIDCLDDALLQTAPAGGGFDMSLGTGLPVTGVYRVGHILQDIDAAASASWGWIVTTAGGAMTGAWASGQTYVAGTWYRNAAGRVYELITAGGGTTSVEPTGTTVGTDETGADSYVWRCRATASARWAPLAALSAAAALP